MNAPLKWIRDVGELGGVDAGPCSSSVRTSAFCWMNGVTVRPPVHLPCMTDDECIDYTESLFAGEIEPLPDALPEGAEEDIGALLDRYLVPPEKALKSKRAKTRGKRRS